MLRIISIIASVLLIATCSIAAVDSLKGTTVNVDNNFLDTGVGSAPAIHYQNLGARIYSQIGWTTSGTAYGKTISGWNISSLTNGDHVDSAFVYFYNDQAITNAPEVSCYGVPSNWIEGTRATAAYEAGSSGMKTRGYGTAFNGTTVAQADSSWNATEQHGNRYLTTTQVTAQNTWYRWDVTSMVADSHAAGVNYVSFLFYDTAYVGGAVLERCTMILSEAAGSFPTLVPYMVVYTDSDPSVVKITVTPPSAPLTDYKCRVSIQTYGQPLNLDELTFLASDLTTKLYWCPDSLNTAGTKLWAYVINDWATSPENIYVTQVENTSYQNCDSVFIVHETFNTPFNVTSEFSTLSEWNCTLIDSLNPIATSTSPSILREPFGPFYDSQETESSKKWKYWIADANYTAGVTPDVRYTGTFLFLFTAPTVDGTWTRQDTVRYDSTGGPKVMRIEDPVIEWLPNLNKWILVCENHQSSPDYHVGLFTADSLDQPTWHFVKNIPLLEPSALGGPTNWLNKEQASPALCFTPDGDTLYLPFEAFDGAGTSLSFMGMAISFDGTGGYAGDTLGLDWHLLDSTGAINDANPSPIVRYGETGAIDSAASIPDGMIYLDGNYIVSAHTLTGSVIYSGSRPENLVRVAQDSTRLVDNLCYDPNTGRRLGTIQRSISGNADSSFVVAAVNYDSSAIISNDFNIQSRAARLASHWRLRGGYAASSGGQLIMFPPQRTTSSMSIMSTDSFNTGVWCDIWMAATSATASVPHLQVSLGDDTLQDYSGTSGYYNGNWEWTSTKRGNDWLIHPTSGRLYQDNPGLARSAVSSATTIDANSDTLSAMHKHSFVYTSQDSLLWLIEGVSKIRHKDATHTGTYRRLVISQGEQESTEWGGVVRIDSVRVSKFTTAEASAVTSDSLMLSVLSEDSNWNIFNCWLRAWRSW